MTAVVLDFIVFWFIGAVWAPVQIVLGFTADDNLLPVVMFLVWSAVALAFYSPMCPLALLGKGPVHFHASLTRTVVVGTTYTPDLVEVVLKSEGSLFPVSCTLDSCFCFHLFSHKGTLILPANGRSSRMFAFS